MTTKKKRTSRRSGGLSRRGFILSSSAIAGAAAFPHIWIPGRARASTSGFNTAKHFLYFRLSGGFRFPTCFNANVAQEFNPFGQASSVAEGTEWGVGSLLADDGWLTPELETEGLSSVTALTNDMAVLPCVDHEPLAGGADGNHATGLERFLTGYVGGETGLFTMINYGLRARYEAASESGDVILPAIIMGNPGMARGVGDYAAYRPPILRGDDLDQFAFGVESVLDPWMRELAQSYDLKFRDSQNLQHYGKVDGYIQSREATQAYADIFNSDILKIRNNSTDLHDGISNRRLEDLIGNDSTARNIRLALRLFHFGCPAVYMDQGGYDLHSNEESALPGRVRSLNRLISAVHQTLHEMQHPDGGTYWDHTVVAFGSEFSRTARGSQFNSARGSDHGGDYATRWMSMPMMGGPIKVLGQQLGETRSSDLKALGSVYSYRATMKTFMDMLGCDHSEFFPADDPFEDLFG